MASGEGATLGITAIGREILMRQLIFVCVAAAITAGCTSTGVQTSLIRETPVVEPVTVPTQGSYTTGNLALRRGDLDTAITAYRQTLKSSPSMYEARYNLGIALLKQAREEFFLYAGLAPDSENLETIAPMLQCLEAFVGEGSDVLCR